MTDQQRREVHVLDKSPAEVRQGGVRPITARQMADSLGIGLADARRLLALQRRGTYGQLVAFCHKFNLHVDFNLVPRETARDYLATLAAADARVVAAKRLTTNDAH